MGGIGRLLVWLSGADYETLAVQHGRVRAKYVGTGTGIVITGLIAGFSMWFALTTALGASASAAGPLAACWALAIMCIDRWLVVSLERREGRGPLGYLVAASPRLALALVLGFVISTPITLRVFQKEIDFHLQLAQSAARSAYLSSPARTKLENQINADQERVDSLAAGGTGTSAAQPTQVTNLEKQLANAEVKLKNDTAQQTGDYNNWQCQLYGNSPTGATCPAGDGKLAGAAESAYETSKTAVQQDQETIAGLEGSIAKAQTGVGREAAQELPTAKTTLKNDQNQLAAQDKDFAQQNAGDTGLLARINALDAAAAASPGLQVARWLLFLVFLLIDCLPALMAITHVLNDPDDYEKAIGAGVATREWINDTNLRDRELDAETLSWERAQRRDATAKVRADAEQQVAMHNARRWADAQTGPRGRSARERAGGRAAARSGRSWPQDSTPTAYGRRQVFIRRYTPPPPGHASQNGHVSGSGSWGGTS
jgi:hypothetical protein